MKAGVACAMAASWPRDAGRARAPEARLLLTLRDRRGGAGRGTRASIADGLELRLGGGLRADELRAVRAARGNCYLDVTVGGVSAHAGNPDLGVNAIQPGPRWSSASAARPRAAARAHPC